MQQTLNKYKELTSLLKAHSPFILAFSGGLDSRFLAHTAKLANLAFSVAHLAGPHVPKYETEAALTWLKRHNIVYQVISFNPLHLADVAEGNKNRCYACKREMFKVIQAKAKAQTILEGSNASDRLKFRPGAKALSELGVISPMAIVELTKNEIRTLAESTGLDQPNQPSRPCLLTRFDYGICPNKALLGKLEAAEAAIVELGFLNFRLRVFTDKASLLQVDWQEIDRMEAKRSSLEQILRFHGFEQTEIEAEIELSGFFDQENKTDKADLSAIDNLEILRKLS